LPFQFRFREAAHPAAADLEANKAYLDIHYPHLSHSTIRKLYEGIRSLKMMPDRGRAGFRAGTREMVFRPLPYIVTYRLTKNAVEILRIWHGAQDRAKH
jgi:plasmid stabilization system protein ParE